MWQARACDGPRILVGIIDFPWDVSYKFGMLKVKGIIFQDLGFAKLLNYPFRARNIFIQLDTFCIYKDLRDKKGLQKARKKKNRQKNARGKGAININ